MIPRIPTLEEQYESAEYTLKVLLRNDQNARRHFFVVNEASIRWTNEYDDSPVLDLSIHNKTGAAMSRFAGDIVVRSSETNEVIVADLIDFPIPGNIHDGYVGNWTIALRNEKWAALPKDTSRVIVDVSIERLWFQNGQETMRTTKETLQKARDEVARLERQLGIATTATPAVTTDNE